MDDNQRELNRLKAEMQDWSYGRLKTESELEAFSMRKAAAAEILQELDKEHQERRHRENVNLSRWGVWASWVGAVISLLAALDARRTADKVPNPPPATTPLIQPATSYPSTPALPGASPAKPASTAGPASPNPTTTTPQSAATPPPQSTPVKSP